MRYGHLDPDPLDPDPLDPDQQHCPMMAHCKKSCILPVAYSYDLDSVQDLTRKVLCRHPAL